MSSNGFVFCSGPGVGVGERMFSENRVRMAETVLVAMSDMIDCSQVKVKQKWVAGRYGQVRSGIRYRFVFGRHCSYFA